jgi:hypothetical protein
MPIKLHMDGVIRQACCPKALGNLVAQGGAHCTVCVQHTKLDVPTGTTQGQCNEYAACKTVPPSTNCDTTKRFTMFVIHNVNKEHTVNMHCPAKAVVHLHSALMNSSDVRLLK